MCLWSLSFRLLSLSFCHLAFVFSPHYPMRENKTRRQPMTRYLQSLNRTNETPRASPWYPSVTVKPDGLPVERNPARDVPIHPRASPLSSRDRKSTRLNSSHSSISYAV